MKILINEQQFIQLIEQTKAEYDFYSLQHNTIYEVFQDIAKKQKIRFFRIKPTQYKQALMEFMKYRDFFRFPTNKIIGWKDNLLYDITLLSALTEIHGHSQNFPYEEFYDTFDHQETYTSDQYNLFDGGLSEVTPEGEYTTWAKKRFKETNNREYLQRYNFTAIYEFLDDVRNIDDYVPFFSNGQPVLSDYGLQPLLDLAEKIVNQTDPKDIIVTINKILDVAHQRSDLAELFIEGGTQSLDQISNN